MIRKWTLTAIAFLFIKSDLLASSRDVSKLEFFLTNPMDPSVFANTMELICSEGYPVQQHKAITEDGYIINLFRIPNGVRKQRVSPKRRGYMKFHLYVHPDYYGCLNESLAEKATGPPVLLQHGLIAASDSWVVQGAGYDLAYLLADAGYDVWMSDIRGNFYSRTHLYRSTNSKEYWDFSFHEMAYYDLPAIIDYILTATSHEKLYYIGHSMGTTMNFILGATRPEYMSKIRLDILLAPVANVSTTLATPPRGIMSQFTERSLIELERKQIYEFAPRVNWVPLLLNRFCNDRSLFQDLCYDIGISIDGHPYYNLLRKTFTRVASHFLSGASTKTIFHFLQILRRQRFQYYDYGEEENFRRYHQASPPEYNVRGITIPVALIYSDTDVFSDAEQVENLARLLPNVVFMKRLTKFLHTDFIVAHNAKDMVYNDVLELLKKY